MTLNYYYYVVALSFALVLLLFQAADAETTTTTTTLSQQKIVAFSYNGKTHNNVFQQQQQRQLRQSSKFQAPQRLLYSSSSSSSLPRSLLSFNKPESHAGASTRNNNNNRSRSSTCLNFFYENSHQNIICSQRISAHDSNRKATSSNNEDDKEIMDNSSSSSSKLDVILSKLTSAFPFFVLLFAVVGGIKPNLFQYVNQQPNSISTMLSFVMCGMGLTLTTKDFQQVLEPKNRFSIPLGVLCQFIIMPLSAFCVGKCLVKVLSSTATAAATSTIDPSSLFLGLLLVGCSPGGTASNLVAFIAHANVALSVLLTSASTLLATLVTPLLVKILIGSSIQISGMALCTATARVVLIPIFIGMLFKSKTPQLANTISRFTPFLSVLLVAIICGAVVAQNASLFTGMGSGVLLPAVIVSVLSLHILGFTVGYVIPKYIFGRSETTARTISIETGMQNSALAVVLAQSVVPGNVLATLPGGLSATAHSCIGSLLAAYWRLNPPGSTVKKRTDNDEEDDTMYSIPPPPSDDDDIPEYSI